MSGHSKWNNIKHRKAKGDAAKAKVFTKIGREIAVAVKTGGPDPNVNSRLKDLIAKAKTANIPSDNVMRGIKKAAGELGSINYETVTYEGYGPGGSAVIVDALTDNKNRTAGEVRHIFDKYGGALGVAGCVSFSFNTKGVIEIEKLKNDDDDEMMMFALDAGAEDFSAEDDCYVLVCDPSQFGAVRTAVGNAARNITSAEIKRIPNNEVALEPDQLERFLKLYDFLDDNDDVQEISHNVILPDEPDED
ncbi:MAG: YebC/PmpR family DNA-binding transcriptional regulator [Firmicutes bacterium]|nr:YebC/PmpR family DNA-binding transcriptional regulator [Bacillota bacterium]